MNTWQIPAVLALVIYGFWGFFPKLAVSHISPASALVYEVAGTALVGLVIFLVPGFELETEPRGIFFAVLTGLCGILGTLFFLAAAKHGRISLVVSLTALYPLITIILARIFLAEPMTSKNIIGMIMALAAIVLLST